MIRHLRTLTTALTGILASGALHAQITLTPIGTHRTGLFDKSSAEIVAHDPGTQRLFVVNTETNSVDVLDIHDPAQPSYLESISLPGRVNSVAISQGIAACAVEDADDRQAPGQVVFIEVATGEILNTLSIGVMPDMITFTPDGSRVLTANEGEPSKDYTSDPEGSVSIIRVGDGTPETIRALTQDAVTPITFESWNARAEELINRGVRIYGPGATVAQDLEPEYIAISPDSKTAYIALQENNALAIICLKTHKLVDIVALGYSDHSRGQPRLVVAPGVHSRADVLGGLWFNPAASKRFEQVFDTLVSEIPNDPDAPGTLAVQSMLLNLKKLSLAARPPQLLYHADGETPFTPPASPIPAMTRDSEGNLWIAEPARPLFYQFSPEGILLNTYTPSAETAEEEDTATLLSTGKRPGLTSTCGFGGLAWQADDTRLALITREPCPSTDPTGASHRIFLFDPAQATLTAEYRYRLESTQPSPTGGSPATTLSGLAWKGGQAFYTVERDSDHGSLSRKNLFEFDLTGSDNLLDPDQTGHRSLVWKNKITTLPAQGHDGNPEGMAVSANGDIYLIDPGHTGDRGENFAILRVLFPPGTNGLDASDRDGGVNIRNWPIYGMYQPDSIAAYTVDGHTYIVTANEGDSRDLPGYSEETRIRHLSLSPAFFPDAADLQKPENLGRLVASTPFGDLTGDGSFEKLYAQGTRSFAIWDANGSLIYDSGADFENILARDMPEAFNANHRHNQSRDSRSDNKGPEPEGLALGQIDGRTYAFIALERPGGIMTYDITDPRRARFVSYINNRDFSHDAEMVVTRQQDIPMDLAPEGLLFIPAHKSPTGHPLLAVANEVSGTTTIYAINP